MTQISQDEVRHLAQLSSLQLTDEEVDDLQHDIGRIINYIEQLSQLDTDKVEPTYQVTGLTNVWREDDVDQGEVTREQLLTLAPERLDTSVKVPKVL